MTEYDLRPVENDQGTWDALDEHGYGHCLWATSEEEVWTWINGYNTGARENM